MKWLLVTCSSAGPTMGNCKESRQLWWAYYFCYAPLVVLEVGRLFFLSENTKYHNSFPPKWQYYLTGRSDISENPDLRTKQWRNWSCLLSNLSTNKHYASWSLFFFVLLLVLRKYFNVFWFSVFILSQSSFNKAQNYFKYTVYINIFLTICLMNNLAEINLISTSCP